MSPATRALIAIIIPLQLGLSLHLLSMLRSLVALYGNLPPALAAWPWHCAISAPKCSDVVEYGYPLDAIHDFTDPHDPASLPRCDLTITNPAFGNRGKLAEAFVEAGLRRISCGGALCLLLPADFDSAVTRKRFFRDCPQFIAKIVLTRRIVWFERTDGIRAGPKENSAWFVWSHLALRAPQPPLTLYAPAGHAFRNSTTQHQRKTTND
jgi:hypothetical protein